MKKKLMTIGLVMVLVFSMTLNALAASNRSKKPQKEDDGGGSSSSNTVSEESSGSTTTSNTAKKQEATVSNTAPGGRVSARTVKLAITGLNGTVSSTTLDVVIVQSKNVIMNAAYSPSQAVAAVQALMTTAPTDFFLKTVKACAEMKGSAMVVNNCGTIKTVAIAKDMYGNNIASAGIVKYVTKGALIMLMSVNSDGEVEYVEGVVDPVSGAVMGAFRGKPAVITVLVIA